MSLTITKTYTVVNNPNLFSTVQNSKEIGKREPIPLANHDKSSLENIRFYKRKPGSIYVKLKYKYLGKNSEGNRFIRNGDLWCFVF